MIAEITVYSMWGMSKLISYYTHTHTHTHTHITFCHLITICCMNKEMKASKDTEYEKPLS